MVDLTHIDLATAEDQAYGIEHWARLFKASTWEELKMIAKNSQVLTEASKALYQLNADEIMRQRCRAREDFIPHKNAMKRQNQELIAENAALNTKINTLTTEKDTWEAEREQILAELTAYKE